MEYLIVRFMLRLLAHLTAERVQKCLCPYCRGPDSEQPYWRLGTPCYGDTTASQSKKEEEKIRNKKPKILNLVGQLKMYNSCVHTLPFP